jgi:predicted ester cyclase
MSTEENKEIARRVLEEALNKHNMAVVDELVDSSYVYHAPLWELKGQEGYKQGCTMILTSLPDHHMTFEDIIAEDDKVAMRFTVTGTHTGGDYMGIAATGKQITMTGIIISRISGGKIVEDWEIVDQLGIMQQLGIIPPMGQGK